MIHAPHGVTLVYCEGTRDAQHETLPGPVDFELSNDSLLIVLAPEQSPWQSDAAITSRKVLRKPVHYQWGPRVYVLEAPTSPEGA